MRPDTQATRYRRRTDLEKQEAASSKRHSECQVGIESSWRWSEDVELEKSKGQTKAMSAFSLYIK
jgi:hypothetical protein